MTKSHEKYPEEWAEILAGYVLGDLSTDEVTRMHQLISDYPEIIEEIDRFQAALAMLPLGLNESQPAADLRDRIEAVAMPLSTDLLADPLDPARNLQLTSTRRSPFQYKKFWKAAQIGFGGLGAIALILLGIDNYQMRQQIANNAVELQKHRQTIAILQAADNRLISLKGMGAIPAASGSVMIAPNEQTAMITIQNLRPISPDDSYRLWAVVDGKKIDCAKFRPDAQGNVYVKVPLAQALTQSTTVIITIEPNKDMLEPTGEMVMKGEV
ncbi:MAG: hypothetical protein DCE90_16545 [Pseudanabaena sp.]|nr:MAG: hypothetical protein DCE90_16545 [Pseudanabaena sp.]